VQVGVTLAGFLSAAFGASRLSAPLGDYLAGLGVPRGLADGASFVVVVLLITYTSLVLGELAPKRLGLQRAEGTAQRLAPWSTASPRCSGRSSGCSARAPTSSYG
jgi:CBS domain containing-hemolysin-like protein